MCSFVGAYSTKHNIDTFETISDIQMYLYISSGEWRMVHICSTTGGLQHRLGSWTCVTGNLHLGVILLFAITFHADMCGCCRQVWQYWCVMRPLWNPSRETTQNATECSGMWDGLLWGVYYVNIIKQQSVAQNAVCHEGWHFARGFTDSCHTSKHEYMSLLAYSERPLLASTLRWLSCCIPYEEHL